MTQPTDDQLAAAAQKARADHETAREIAARLLAPPDPVDILAGVIADRGDVADERDELRAKCDAMTADLVAIRGIVGRHRAPIAEAVRQIRDELIRERDLARADRDAARVARKDATEEVERLSAMLKAAEADAETQRTAAADLRAALDRVAMEAGVDTEGDGFDVADRVIAVLRAMQARQSSPTSRPAALPADLRTYLETRRDRLQGGHGLGLAAEIAALNRWLALPVAEASK